MKLSSKSKINFFIVSIVLFSSCAGGKKLDTLQKNYDVIIKRNKVLETKLDSVVDVTDRQKREIRTLNEELSQERSKSSAYSVQVKETTAPVKHTGTKLSKEDEYNQKANFILNFGKFIFWPKNYMADKNFIIAVYGKSVIYDKLVEVTAGKFINGKKIVIQTLEVGKPINDVHIVFFPEQSNAQVAGQVSKIKAKPILVITEYLENSSKNYMLNFLDSDEKVKFSLNRQNANNAGLNVNLDLMKLSF